MADMTRMELEKVRIGYEKALKGLTFNCKATINFLTILAVRISPCSCAVTFCCVAIESWMGG